MTRFAAVLQRVEARLTVPQPVRSRILEEMASDLEDLYAAYRARGLDEAEALRRTETALGPSAQAVEQLVLVHRPMWERLLARFSSRGRNRVERVLLTALAMAGVLLGAGALTRQGILGGGSPFVWPMLLLSAGALALAAKVFFRLFVQQDHRSGTLRNGLLPLLVLVVATVLLAGFGFLWEIFSIARDVEKAGAAPLDMLLPRLRRASEVLALGLTSGLAVTLGWFHLRGRALTIERAEADLPVPPSHRARKGGLS